jgi:hypothetical protein
MLASANVSGSVTNITAATVPVAASKSCVPTHLVTNTREIPARALGRRSANSESPNSRIAAICSQWNSTGLSMNGVPSRSGTSQLPVRIISRVNCA